MFRIEVHGSGQGDLLYVLEQAFDARYDTAINQTPTLEFSLPADDDKASSISLSEEIWLFEDLALVDKFRILELKSKDEIDRQFYRYEASQVIDYLCDTIVSPTTWTDKTVTEIFIDLIALQDRFTLGTIDPVCNVTISGELKADWEPILEVMKNVQELSGGVLYVDPQAMTLNLREIGNTGEDKGQQLRYRKNLAGVSRSIEKKSLVTKLWVLGSGEDIAKRLLSNISRTKQDTDKSQDASYGYITIFYYQTHQAWTGLGNALPANVTVYKNDADNTSVWTQGPNANRLRCAVGSFDPAAAYKVSFYHAGYLCAADAVDDWGLVEGTMSFETAESDEQLWKMGVNAMDECKNPRTVYSLNAVDLSYLGGEWSFEKLKLGNRVRVIDETLGIDFADYIVKISRKDLTQPHRINVDISNRPENINEYLASAAKKREISEKKVTTKIPPHLVGDRKAPTAPSNVSGSGIFAGILISWDASPETDVQAYEVYRSATSTPPGTPVGSTNALYFIDQCGVDQSYYYWVKAIDTEGYKSNYSDTWGAAVDSSKVNGLNEIMAETIFPVVMRKDVQAWTTNLIIEPNPSANKHNSARWGAPPPSTNGTVKFSDEGSRTINAGSYADMTTGYHYGYFDLDDDPLQILITDDYDAAVGGKRQLVTVFKVSADSEQEIGFIRMDAGGLNLMADFIGAHAIQASMLAAILALITNIMVGDKNPDPLVRYPIEIIGSGTNKGIFLYDASDVLQVAQYAYGTKKGTIEFGAGNGIMNKDGIELKEMALARGIGFTRYMYEGWQYYQCWDSIDGFDTYADSPGEAEVSQFGFLHLNVDGDTEQAYARKRFLYTSVPMSWDKGRRFKLKLYIDPLGVLNFDFRIGVGYLVLDPDTAYTSRQVSFMIDDSPAGLYASSSDGTAEERTNTGVSLAAGTEYLLEAVIDPGNSVKFYVDNVLKATHTTRVPAGTTSADRILTAHLKTVGNYHRAIDVGPFLFVQEP